MRTFKKTDLANLKVHLRIGSRFTWPTLAAKTGLEVSTLKRRMAAVAKVKPTDETVRTGERGPETVVYQVVSYV